jgi:predicted aminopeptidase
MTGPALPATIGLTEPLRRAALGALLGCLTLMSLADAARGATASPSASAARCGRIAFAKQSDDVVFNISVSGTRCSVARDVVSASASTWPSTPAERTYTAHRFRCVGRLVLPNGKAYEHYVCLRRGATVVFDRG